MPFIVYTPPLLNYSPLVIGMKEDMSYCRLSMKWQQSFLIPEIDLKVGLAAYMYVHN